MNVVQNSGTRDKSVFDRISASDESGKSLLIYFDAYQSQFAMASAIFL
jgi:hypothetical protein